MLRHTAHEDVVVNTREQANEDLDGQSPQHSEELFVQLIDSGEYLALDLAFASRHCNRLVVNAAWMAPDIFHNQPYSALYNHATLTEQSWPCSLLK